MPRVRTEDLIDATGVARLLGLSHPNTVSGYQRRYPEMPRPVIRLAKGKILLWHEPDVRKWAVDDGRLTPDGVVIRKGRPGRDDSRGGVRKREKA